MHVPFSLSRIIMSGLLLGMVLSVCTCWFHNIIIINIIINPQKYSIKFFNI
jgi:hypothetical protein